MGTGAAEANAIEQIVKQITTSANADSLGFRVTVLEKHDCLLDVICREEIFYTYSQFFSHW
jgi:hypothetical protein